MMWVFHCSKLANGCNISFNCHFIISYVARFWNHHERRLLKVHRSITFTVHLLLTQTSFETITAILLYTRYYCTHYYGWWDWACLDQKEYQMRGGGGSALRLETYPSNNSMSKLILEWFHLMIAGIIRQWGQIRHSFIRGLQNYKKKIHNSYLLLLGCINLYDCHVNVFPCWQDKIRLPANAVLMIKS